jgi:hypothetical protein
MSQMRVLFEVNPVHTIPIQICVLILVRCALKILQGEFDTSKLVTVSTARPSVDPLLGLYIIAIQGHFELKSSLNMHAVWRKIPLETVVQVPSIALYSYHLLFLPLTTSGYPYSCITHMQSLINHILLSTYTSSNLRRDFQDRVFPWSSCLSMALQPFLGPWPLLSFLLLYTQSVGLLGLGGSVRRKASTYTQNNTNTE